MYQTCSSHISSVIRLLIHCLQSDFLFFRSMIVLRDKALQLLIHNAESNVNDHDLHAETLSFLLAARGDNYNITDVVFPGQSISGHFVGDHVVDSQDTSTF